MIHLVRICELDNSVCNVTLGATFLKLNYMPKYLPPKLAYRVIKNK